MIKHRTATTLFLLRSLVIALSCGLAICFALYPWPTYDWDLQVPSPDRAYDLVVLRKDASAITDFSYMIYVFPHGEVPLREDEGTRVSRFVMWRTDKYLVYESYNYPLLRWIDARSVELHLDEANYLPVKFDPIKHIDRTGETVLFSLSFGKEDTHGAAFSRP